MKLREFLSPLNSIETVIYTTGIKFAYYFRWKHRKRGINNNKHRRAFVSFVGTNYTLNFYN